jgi:hypothetical protein
MTAGEGKDLPVPDRGWSWSSYTERTGTVKLTLTISDQWLKQIDRAGFLERGSIVEDLRRHLEALVGGGSEDA